MIADLQSMTVAQTDSEVFTCVSATAFIALCTWANPSTRSGSDRVVFIQPAAVGQAHSTYAKVRLGYKIYWMLPEADTISTSMLDES